MTLVGRASNGFSFTDKWLAFFIGGYGILGLHRQWLRKWFFSRIESNGRNGSVNIQFYMEEQLVSLSMRQGNVSDYLMAGELIRGGYQSPDFTPKSIVDGGANIGTFAIMAAKLFPNARLYCYEPDSENYIQLQKNLVLNRIQADVKQMGLWSDSQICYYHPSTSETGYINNDTSGNPVFCELPDVGEDCWMKLDVEGAEYVVLPELFRRQHYPRWISLEIHFFEEKGESLITLLGEHGYRINGGDMTAEDCTQLTAYR